MALPWLAALSVIPWRTILENAPAIARSADALLARTAAPRPQGDSPSEVYRLLADRVAALEQRDRETSELLARVMGQLGDLTAATEVLQARSRGLLIIATAALVFALLASGLIVWLR